MGYVESRKKERKKERRKNKERTTKERKKEISIQHIFFKKTIILFNNLRRSN